VSDGVTLKCGVTEAGDEPYLMHESSGSAEKPGAMVIVARIGSQVRSRPWHWRAGRRAGRRLPALAIKRDLDIVLLDSQKPFGNGWLLPAAACASGKRAAAADVIVLTRWQDGLAARHVLTSMGLPVYRTRHAALGLSRLLNGSMSDIGIATSKTMRGAVLRYRAAGLVRAERQAAGRAARRHLRFGDHHAIRETTCGASLPPRMDTIC